MGAMTDVSPLHRVLDRAQRIAARSPLAVRLAVLLRNQARCVIKYYLAESPDVHETGEVWLRDAVASRCSSVVDVGANVGDWLGGMLDRKRGDALFRALAFEPSQSAARLLRERFENDARVDVVEAALGDREGSLIFFEEHAAGKGSTLVPGFTRIKGQERRVTVTTLASALASAGWERADFVKIDAEGYDLRVVRGGEELLRSRRLGIVQFEYNRPWQLAGETLSGAYALFERHGYRVFLLKREGLFTLNYSFYEEYFEYSNFVAIGPEWMDELKGYVRGNI
jgi:FkbM family methyltransferase